MTYFVRTGVIKDRMYPKYLNGKLWSYHLSCFINPFLYDQAKVKIGDHFLSFRFDIGVCNNGFVSITKLKNGRINLRITNLWKNKRTKAEILIYSVKDSKKFKDIQARFLFNLCETSITSRIAENVCNIVVFDSSWLVFTNYCI